MLCRLKIWFLWTFMLMCVGTVTGVRRKVIVDLDAGVDDAFALALLLAADDFKEIDLLAVTCIQGNTGVHNVSLNVLKLLDTAKRLEVPVYRGAEFSLETTPPYDYFFGYDGFGDIDYPHPPNSSLVQTTHAVIALLQLSKMYEGEVTLLCLGPLTNYALATRLDPDFPSRIAQVVVLGGAIKGIGNVRPGLEFNFFSDPLAAYILFNTTSSPVFLVPWELVFEDAALQKSWRKDVLGELPGPIMALLNRAEASTLHYNGEKWVSGDLLAAALLVNPDLTRSTRKLYIGVEVHASLLSGATVADYEESLSRPHNAEVVQSVDVSAFKVMLLRYLASNNTC